MSREETDHAAAQEGPDAREQRNGGGYRVTSSLLAKGGFGQVYPGAGLDGRDREVQEVAIKASTDPVSWRGEAWFGRLLRPHPHVVRLLDAFPVVDGTGPTRQVKHVLVHEWIAEGDLKHYLARTPEPRPEDDAVEQVAYVLHALALLHRRGICHGDLTPGNLFVRDGRLLIGDLGVASQALLDGPAEMLGISPDEFLPPDNVDFVWSPAGDVYQVGLIALWLLTGEVTTKWDVSGRALKALPSATRSRDRSGKRARPSVNRFEDAQEALTVLLGQPVRPARAPRSLRGQHVVFTGTLPTRRADAQAQARAAGAHIQGRVNGQTSLVVAGQPNPLQIGQAHGTKLFDAHRRIRRGQAIAIIDGARFARLAAKAGTARSR